MNVSNTIEYEPEQKRYRARYEESRESPGIAIIEAIASVEQIDPTAVDVLHGTVDVEALDTVLQSASDDCYVEFQYHGYHIVAHSNGTIELRPLESSPTDPIEE